MRTGAQGTVLALQYLAVAVARCNQMIAMHARADFARQSVHRTYSELALVDTGSTDDIAPQLTDRFMSALVICGCGSDRLLRTGSGKSGVAKCEPPVISSCMSDL